MMNHTQAPRPRKAHPMLRRASLAAALLLTTLAAHAQGPTPEQFFGFKMGTDNSA
jgi:hypothetical protein